MPSSVGSKGFPAWPLAPPRMLIPSFSPGLFSMQISCQCKGNTEGLGRRLGGPAPFSPHPSLGNSNCQVLPSCPKLEPGTFSKWQACRKEGKECSRAYLHPGWGWVSPDHHP